jgi:hypothetical protein
MKTDIVACLNVISGLNTEEEEVQDDEMNPVITPALERKEAIDDVHISHDLSEEEKKQLKYLLMEYQDIFSDIPQVANIIEHKVVTKFEVPIYKRPYHIPYALRDKAKTEIDNMIKAGIVEPYDNPYTAPIIFIKKKDQSLRFCVDYRGLNKETVFNHVPMPRMDTVLNKVSKANYISKFDLTKSYWQVPLDLESRMKSSLVTPSGNINLRLLPLVW